jgi:hypothetical protein
MERAVVERDEVYAASEFRAAIAASYLQTVV